MSWWPQQNVWEESGFGVLGYWSARAEVWYQSRLKSIQSGEGKPMPGRQWRQALRMHGSKSRRVVKVTTMLAEKRLEQWG